MGMLDKLKARIRGEEPTERLIEKGLVVGARFHRGSGCVIDSAHCWLIHMGDDVSLAPGVHILAHDAAPKKKLNYTRIGLVTIGNNVGIGAHTLIMPGVTIGSNVIIGAMSVVSADIPDNSVAMGSPARRVCGYDEYIEKTRFQMKHRPVFDSRWTLDGGITDEMKQIMIAQLRDGIGFVE